MNTKFTQEIKDKWLARLRDPYSRQHRGSYVCDMVLADGSDTPMCCLGHANFVVSESPYPVEDFDILEAIGRNNSDRLVTMNDCERKSLSEIADYIEANLPAVVE